VLEWRAIARLSQPPIRQAIPERISGKLGAFHDIQASNVSRGACVVRIICLCLLIGGPMAAQVAPVPAATQLPGSPFSIRNNWLIGGTGSWDYLTIDPEAERLYIAHSHSVQVVDLGSGSLAGEIKGFREAHAIALDDAGQYGYVSDGPANDVAVFDRSTLETESRIPIKCSPRSIAFEPQNRLLFAICGSSAGNSGTAPPRIHRPPGSPARPPRPDDNLGRENSAGQSHVVVIDAEKRAPIAEIVMDGDSRFAQSDRDGHVYITVATATDPRIGGAGATYNATIPSRIVRIDSASVEEEAQRRRDAESETASDGRVVLDWSQNRNPAGLLHVVRLPGSCGYPQGLAVDGKDLRLFVACNNQQLLVLNATNGNAVATLTTGPGDDVIDYDPERQLIYSANGAGYGSLTIIQQDANTDSYAVIQNLPTVARARSLAVDPSTGLVYLVTDYVGVDLTNTAAFGSVKTSPIAGSFQVLVVGR